MQLQRRLAWRGAPATASGQPETSGASNWRRAAIARPGALHAAAGAVVDLVERFTLASSAYRFYQISLLAAGKWHCLLDGKCKPWQNHLLQPQN